MVKELKNAAFTNPGAGIVASLSEDGACEVTGIAALNDADGTSCLDPCGNAAYADPRILPLGGYSKVTDVKPVRDESGQLVRDAEGSCMFCVDFEHVCPGFGPIPFTVALPMDENEARWLHRTLFAEELEDGEEVRAQGLVSSFATDEGILFVSDGMYMEVHAESLNSEPAPEWARSALCPVVLDHEPVFEDED